MSNVKTTSKPSGILTWLKHHLVVLPVQVLVSRVLRVASVVSSSNAVVVELKTLEHDEWCTTNISPYTECVCK